jgi:hypothetical protein
MTQLKLKILLERAFDVFGSKGGCVRRQPWVGAWLVAGSGFMQIRKVNGLLSSPCQQTGKRMAKRKITEARGTNSGK